MISNNTGAVQYAVDFNPFGEILREKTETLPARYKFTGKEHDQEADSYNFGARSYLPALCIGCAILSVLVFKLLVVVKVFVLWADITVDILVPWFSCCISGQ